MFNFLKTQKDATTVRLTPQRRLDQALLKAGIEDPTSITKLVISGTVTRLDFKFIRKKMSKSLQELDLSNATLEDGKFKHGALARCVALTSVTIPNWITEIGEGALSNCINLKSFIIPQSVTIIGELAFWGCVSLTSIIIPNSVKELQFRAFNNTGLTSVELPNSLAKIGGSAFGKCANLTSVTIPDSITVIGNGAFSNCTSLVSVDIPASVTDIGICAFDGCDAVINVHPDNPVYESPKGKLVSKFALEMGYCKV